MLYALGSNGAGQLGLGHLNDVSSPEPILIEGNRPPWKVLQLAAGGSHTVILCDDGFVRVTGDNHDGRCGLDGINQVTHFTAVPLPTIEGTSARVVIKQVAATWASTLLLTANGDIYVCGTGDSGELGLGEGVTSSLSLKRIPSFGSDGEKAVHISSGMGHSVAVLSNGAVFGWGKARSGQLGTEVNAAWNPRKIEGIDFSVTHTVCGKDFTIIAGDLERSNLIVLGGARKDRFGLQTNLPSSISSWKDIHASWCSAFLVTVEGDVVAWGRNDHGQLPAASLGKVRAMAAGSEHGLALVDNGTVAAFGWGEHGNCGIPIDHRGDVRNRFNILQVPARVVNVFAGCATSFVQTDDEDYG